MTAPPTGLRRLVTEAERKVNVLNRLRRSAETALKFGRRIGVSSRRTLAAAGVGTGGAVAFALLVPGAAAIMAAPLVGVTCAALAALIVPEGDEERRLRELDDLEERIRRAASVHPELVPALRDRYEQVLLSESRNLLTLPTERRLLPPGEEPGTD